MALRDLLFVLGIKVDPLTQLERANATLDASAQKAARNDAALGSMGAAAAAAAAQVRGVAAAISGMPTMPPSAVAPSGNETIRPPAPVGGAVLGGNNNATIPAPVLHDADGLIAATRAAKALKDNLKDVPPAAEQAKAALKPDGGATFLSQFSQEFKNGLGIGAGVTAAAIAVKALTFAVTGLRDAIAETVEEGDALGDTATRLGLGVDEVQSFGEVIKRAGGDASSFDVIAKGLAVSLDAARVKGSDAAQKFADLGVSLEDGADGPRELGDVLGDTLINLAAIPDAASRVAKAQDILGKGATNITAAIGDGSDAIREQIDAFRESAAFTQENVAQMQLLGDANDELSLQWKGVRTQIVAALVPAMIWITERAAKIVEWFRKMNKETSILSTLFKVFIPGGLIAGIGGISKGLGVAWGWLAKLVPIGALVTGFLTRFLIPLFVLDDVLGFLQGKESVLGDIINGLAGSDSAAARLSAGLRQVASDGIAAFSAMWALFTSDSAEATENAEMSLLQAVGAMENHFIDLGNFIAQIFGADSWAALWANGTDSFGVAVDHMQGVLQAWLDGAPNMFLDTFAIIGELIVDSFIGVFKDVGSMTAGLLNMVSGDLKLGDKLGKGFSGVLDSVGNAVTGRGALGLGGEAIEGTNGLARFMTPEESLMNDRVASGVAGVLGPHARYAEGGGGAMRAPEKQFTLTDQRAVTLNFNGQGALANIVTPAVERAMDADRNVTMEAISRE